MAQKLSTFKYIAVAANGKRVEEQTQATSAADVVSALHRSGFTPIKVVKVGGLTRDISLSSSSQPKLSTQQRAEFCHQLHQLLRAGISISDSLTTISQGMKDKASSDMLRTISDRIVSGTSLAAAFDGFPKSFDPVFIAYIAAAEESGDLVQVSQRLVEVMEKRAEIRRKIVSVTIYPALVTSVVLFMLVFIILFLVPRYADIYSSFDAELPAPTQLLLVLSRFMPLVLGVIAASIFGFFTWNRSQVNNLQVGTRLDRFKFKMPIMGRLFHKLAVMRFCQTAGGALAAGVQTHEALELAGRASGSRWVRATVTPMQDGVRSGEPLSVTMDRYPELYPPTVRTLVQTGESTGERTAMLLSSARALEDEIDVLVSTMSAKIEVALLVFMAVTVGSILIALYLPILTLTTTISEGF